MINKGTCFPLVLLFFFPSYSWSLDKNSLTALKLQREKEVVNTTQKLISHIINKDIDGIIALIGDPSMCGDSILSREKILADLKNDESNLYIRLFDTQRYQKKHRAKVLSLSDYFKGREVSNIKVSFLMSDSKSEFSLAEVYFGHDIDFLFVFEDNKWFLIEGLYECP